MIGPCHRLPRLGLALGLGLGMLGLAASAAAPSATLRDERIYTFVCDASAAAPTVGDSFVVADDENSILRVYSAAKPGPPTGSFDMSAFLGGKGKHVESDIEAAARAGDIIYWITSHERGSGKNVRSLKHRFFATRVDAQGTLQPVGIPFTDLVPALISEPLLKSYRLEEAARRTSDEKGGLNIEGLAAKPDGTLLIGLRNPIPRGRALIVPLLNPTELTAASPAVPRFGDPIELDLRGAGVRDLLWTENGLLIAAGSPTSAGDSALWRWQEGHLDRLWKASLRHLNIEVLVELPRAAGGKQILALSDDGNLNIGGMECKDLPRERRRFRAFTVSLAP